MLAPAPQAEELPTKPSLTVGLLPRTRSLPDRSGFRTERFISPLSKNVTDFVGDVFVFQIFRLDLFQLFQKLSLFTRQHCRRHD